jgi:hypothetical protein
LEPTIPASERPQTHALDRAATGIGKIKIYSTIILPVDVMGVKLGLSNLRKEHRLRVFENRVLRKIFDLRGTRWGVKTR